MLMIEISKTINRVTEKYGTLKDIPKKEMEDAVGILDAFSADFKNELRRRHDETVLYVVRLWDGWDGIWMDVSDPMPQEEAKILAGDKNEERSGTGRGNREGKYEEGVYYAAFPADTNMLWSEERSQTRGWK